MKATVTLTNTLDDLWGISDLLEGQPRDAWENLVIDLVCEDLTELIDKASWKVSFDEPERSPPCDTSGTSERR